MVRRGRDQIRSIECLKCCNEFSIDTLPEETKKLSRFGVEEFVVDGAIVLNYLGIGEEYNRSLLTRKMRRTNHGKDLYPFEMIDKGIVVRKVEVYNTPQKLGA